MEDSLITSGRGASTTPDWTAATLVAPALAEVVETVVVAAGELFIFSDPGTVIDSDRATGSDWVVVLDPVWGIGGGLGWGRCDAGRGDGLGGGSGGGSKSRVLSSGVD